MFSNLIPVYSDTLAKLLSMEVRQPGEESREWLLSAALLHLASFSNGNWEDGQ
jgi:hypothetical protein